MKLIGRKDWDTAESGEGGLWGRTNFWALKTLKNWRDCKSDDRGFVEQKKMRCKDRGRRSQPLESVCCKYRCEKRQTQRQPRRQSQIQKQLKVQCSHTKSSQPSEIGTHNAGPWCLSNPSVTMTAQTLEYEDISLRRHCFCVFLQEKKHLAPYLWMQPAI